MASTVVSWILGVSGSSGQEPSSKDLQNKQCTSGGVLAASPMLKSDREIGRVNASVVLVE